VQKPAGMFIIEPRGQGGDGLRSTGRIVLLLVENGFDGLEIS